MVSKVVNENMVKLKELTDRICAEEATDINETDYKIAVEEINNVFTSEIHNIEDSQNKEKKLKCYENICSNIQIILNKFKIV